MNKLLETLNERGFISQCTDFEGLSALFDSERVSFYIGCDPTGESLHVGHMVPFFAAKHLIAAGHRAIALIGGGTARIGDPSGKSEMRKMLSYADIDNNSFAIKAQLEKFFAGDAEGDKVLFANNKDWLATLNYIDFLRDIGRHFSVNRMLSFESYKKRMETGLSFIEFNYQLLQSYDFYELYKRFNCKLQIGGDDQWGNIVAGMELIRRLGGAEEGKEGKSPVFGLTFPLVTTSGGAKMGKTEKGAVFLDKNKTPPYDFFQYWRNAADEDVLRFLLLFTFLPVSECKALCASGKNPNEGKERLAWEVTALIHGKEEAEKALSGARAAFGRGGEKSEMPSKSLPRAKFDGGYGIVELFFDASLCASKGEARRLVEQGGAAVKSGGEDAFTQIKDVKALIDGSFLDGAGELVLRAGKKHFCRIIAE